MRGGKDEILGRGSIKCKGKRRQRERDESRRRQWSEFIFINGQRAERELLKRKKMNERMSVNGGGGGVTKGDVIYAPSRLSEIQ